MRWPGYGRQVSPGHAEFASSPHPGRTLKTTPSPLQGVSLLHGHCLPHRSSGQQHANVQAALPCVRR
jgi:hypothetical protein